MRDMGEHGRNDVTHDPRTAESREVPRLIAVAASLFLPCVVFVSVPNSIILGNLGEIAYDGVLVAAGVASFALSGLALAPLTRFTHRSVWARRTLRLMIAAGLSIIAWNLVAAHWYITPHRLTLAVLRDVSIATVASVLVATLPWPVLARATGAMMLVVLCTEIVRNVVAVSKVSGREGNTVRVVETSDGSHPRRGNVYHVLLDAFQGESFPAILQRHPELALDDFTFYPNFTTQYLYTRLSWTSMMTGRYWQPNESFTHWLAEGRDGGYVSDMANAGIDATLYSLVLGSCPDGAACVAYGSLDDRWHDAATQRDLLVDLWFTNLLPASLQTALGSSHVSWDMLPQAAVISNWQGFSVTHEIRRVLSSEEVHGVVARTPSTLTAWEALLADEERRPPNGQYVLFHSLLPHVPYRVEADCTLRGNTGGDLEAALDQAACSICMIHQLVAVLKALDRYDDATIIVHGDHGMHPVQGRMLRESFPDVMSADLRVGPDDDPLAVLAELAQDRAWRPTMWEEDYTDWRTAPGIALRSSALLLVKWPGATESRIDSTPRSMIDLAPTLLRAMGLPYEKYPGIPLQEQSAAESRVPTFFASELDVRSGTLQQFTLVDGRWQYQETLRVE